MFFNLIGHIQYGYSLLDIENCGGKVTNMSSIHMKDLGHLSLLWQTLGHMIFHECYVMGHVTLAVITGITTLYADIYGTKALPEAMLTCHQRCSVAFTREHFQKNSWST